MTVTGLVIFFCSNDYGGCLYKSLLYKNVISQHSPTCGKPPGVLAWFCCVCN